MDVGVDGGTAGDAARGHVGVILWVDILKALPWHTRAELWGRGDTCQGVLLYYVLPPPPENAMFAEFTNGIYLNTVLTWGPVNVGPVGDLFVGALALGPAVWGHQGAGGGLRAGH